MIMKKKVLIVVDSYFREYLPALFLQNTINSAGIDCRITSKFSLGVTYNKFRPDILILPKLHKMPHLAEIKKNTRIILLTAESFTGVKEGIPVYTKLWDIDKADYCFTWGSFDREAYKELNLFPKDRTITTGNPAIEHWYYPGKKPKSKKRIGIATSLRALTHSSASQNPISQIISLEDNGTSGFFDPPNHAESWVAFEAAWLRIIYDIVRDFKDYEISIRPHPLENKEHYEIYKKFHPNLSISKHSSISEWVQEIDYMLSFVSTSQLDAHVNGVRVISMRKLFPDSVMNYVTQSLTAMFKDDFPEPKNYQELREILVNYPATSNKLNAFLLDVFNFPTDKPSQNILGEIQKILKDDCPPAASRKVSLKPMHAFFSALPWGAELLLLFKDIKNYFLGTENVAVSYCPHRFSRNREIKKRVAIISTRSSSLP